MDLGGFFERGFFVEEVAFVVALSRVPAVVVALVFAVRGLATAFLRAGFDFGGVEVKTSIAFNQCS